MKITISIIVATIFFSISIAGCSFGESSESPNMRTDKVIIGTQTLIGPEMIARVNGWLQEDLGDEIEIVFFDAGRDVVNAMASKSINIGYCGSVPASLAVANGINCSIVYIQSVLGTTEALVVRNNLGITDAKGLVGRTIATTFTSTAHYSLLKYLEVNGVSPSDVDIIDMRAGEIVAAYTRGDIDGAFTWDPHVSTMITEDGHMITNAGEVAKLGYATMDVNIVDRDFAERNPDIVKAYIQCMDRAITLFNENPQSAINAWATDTGLTYEECFAQSKGITFLPLEIQMNAEWFGSSALADKLYDTGLFLFNQGVVSSEPSYDLFYQAVTGQFLESN